MILRNNLIRECAKCSALKYNVPTRALFLFKNDVVNAPDIYQAYTPAEHLGLHQTPTKDV